MNKIHTLADRIGITLTPMQETVADRLLHTDPNVVVLSPTGSGKTFAYPVSYTHLTLPTILRV